MASSFPSSRALSAGFRTPARWRWAVVALLLALALRLIPADALRPLDLGVADQGRSAASDTPRLFDQPGDIFPGSAYFFAENAFAPAQPSGEQPATGSQTGATSPHILQIERGPAALPLPARGITPMDDARALQCMTNAIYYEAGNEPEDGQRAVAQVILNRMASGLWPSSVCAVVYQGGERADRGCQFTFSCDGSMARIPAAAAWSRARRVAFRALSGEVFAPAGLSTFYHTLAVRPPWVDRVRPVAVVGAHIFYRLPGQDGAPAAYRLRYSGRETVQPGPYAFVPPPRLLPAPPGPDMLEAPPLFTPAFAAPAPAVQSGAPISPRLSFAPATAELPPASTQGLPQSTIRPEYRNSGRALR